MNTHLKLFAFFLIFISIPEASAAQSLPEAHQPLPKGFQPIANLSFLATAAVACGFRNQKWGDDVTADVRVAVEHLMNEDYAEGATNIQVSIITTNLIQRTMEGAVTPQVEFGCEGLEKSGVLEIGDRAAEHYRQQFGG